MINFSDKDYFSKKHQELNLMQHEREQFKAHQSVPFPTYKKERAKFLSQIAGAELSLLMLESFKPTIAVFAGSFNPFHRGHYNVLEKAENIFDKVIIAFGKNPEKNLPDQIVPNTIKNRQIASYDGLLTDFVSAIGHDVVVIRGLRNSTDFQYEQNQYRYIQELMPDIRIVNIFCDKEFEHISSSGIRTLEKYGRHRNYLLD